MSGLGDFGSSFKGGNLNWFDAMVATEMFDDDYNTEELQPKKRKRKKKYDPDKFSWEQDEDDDPRYSWEQNDEDDDPRYSWER